MLKEGGLVTFSRSFQVDRMIKAADRLLYEAKESRRNLVVSKKY